MFFAAAPQSAKYACMEKGATLYTLTESGYEQTAFLPATYFVTVVKDAGDGYSLVSYLDVVGYMKNDELSGVDFFPKVKYASARFTVSNDSQPANLRLRPGKDSPVSEVMPSGESGTAIGTIEGDELISGAGGKWYYVRYESGGEYRYGYVYGAHVSVEAFGENTFEAEPSPPSHVTEKQEPSYSGLSLPLQTVLIVCLCTPVTVGAFMLRRKPNKAARPESEQPNRQYRG